MTVFITKGPLNPDQYDDIIVSRQQLKESIDFITGKEGYIALQGPRQMGKTTLLYQVHSRLHKNSYGVVYIDLQGMKDLSREAFYQTLSDLIWGGLKEVVDGGTSLWKPQKIDDEWKFTSYLTWLSANTPRVRKLIVILDEIGGIPDSVYLTFFQNLRKFYNAGAQGAKRDLYRKFTIIFAGALDLRRLWEGENSPIRNISEIFFMRDFSQEQVRHLANYLHDFSAPYREAIAEAIFRWTDGHPYLTMRLYELIESDAECKHTDITKIPEYIDQLVLVKVLYGGDNNLSHIIKYLLSE